MSNIKEINRKKRHARVKSRIHGGKPRLVVFRSISHTYVQLINDSDGTVMAAASDLKSKNKGSKIEKAKEVGVNIAKLAQEKKIAEVVFDRNGYKYHGRIKAIAESARESGLKF